MTTLKHALRAILNTLKKASVFCIVIYQQTISLLFPRSCRYYPSCSEYTRLAIEKYGLCIGIYKGFFRILRCNPFHTSNFVDYP